MYLRILKKDFKRKKAMNVILLLFVILAAMFLSSSVSNLLTVLGALDSYLEKANTPDYLIIGSSGEANGEDPIDSYLKNDRLVEDYEILNGVMVGSGNIETVKKQSQEGGGKKYEVTTSAAALFSEEQKYLKVFDEDGNDLDLKPGEIAVGSVEAEHNAIQTGDILRITVGETEKEFTVAHITKDVAFGTTLMGFRRFVLCQEDFAEYYGGRDIAKMTLYSIFTENEEQFEKEFFAQGFYVFSSVDRGMLKLCYIMDMLVAGILIIVSVCLILIAFLILRFTIVFTIQEDYREIGVMKAIGIRENGIRGIYLAKYVAIAFAGTVLGWLLGFPFSELLLKYAITNILVEGSAGYLLMRTLSAGAVIFLVVMFCFISTGKLKRVSPIEAIQEGSTGERFHGKNLLHLHKSRHLSTPFFLACNDITGNVRRFLVLAATFCLGTLLILLPLSATQTLNSDGTIRLFGAAPSDLYLKVENMEKYMGEGGIELLNQDFDSIEKTMQEAGAPVKMRAELMYNVNYYKTDSSEPNRIFTFQSYRYGGSDYDMLEGEMPENGDEVALTKISADKLGVKVGDMLRVSIEGIEHEVILTGIFQSMNMMGESARFAENFEVPFSTIAGMYMFQVDFLGEQTTEEYCGLIEKAFPEYTQNDSRQFIESMVGDITGQLGVFQLLIVIVVLLINALITLLMMKAFIAKERQEIAVLKSIGYKNSELVWWQTLRILIVLGVAILSAVLLSALLAPVTVGQIFRMMGATSIRMVSNPLENYVFYPLLLLGVTGTVAFFAAGAVKRVDTKEINY